MQTNQVPHYDLSDNPTGCCPRFQPEPWDGRDLHFEDKAFVRASTRSLFHVPLNMGRVFQKTFRTIERADAEPEGFVILSHDDSPWHAEHLFAVDHPIAGTEMVFLSGDFFTKVFEGPYAEVKAWAREMEDRAAKRGRRIETLYFFYTTCPRCAKVYGKNYVVAIAKLTGAPS